MVLERFKNIAHNGLRKLYAVRVMGRVILLTVTITRAPALLPLMNMLSLKIRLYPQERARERIGGGVGGLPAVPTKIEEVPFRYYLVVEHFCCRTLDAFLCLTYHSFSALSFLFAIKKFQRSLYRERIQNLLKIRAHSDFCQVSQAR